MSSTSTTLDPREGRRRADAVLRAAQLLRDGFCSGCDDLGGGPVPGRGARRDAHRPSSSPRRHALPRAAAGCGLGLRHRRRVSACARRLLARRLRLAPRRGAPERLRARDHRDRRAAHPLPPRALAGPRRAAPRPHPRLAGLHRRVPGRHRAAHRPGDARRRPGGRVPRRRRRRCPATGFSGPTHDRGLGPGCASAGPGPQLMARLGYGRYVAQGGDWGAFVTTQVALADPEHVAGIHLNMLAPNPGGDDPSTFTPDEQTTLAALTTYLDDEGGYFRIQSTKPHTLGFALDDSPAGLVAWIVEKFRAWSDCDGDVDPVFTKDQLLDNVMLYWVTGTATSSVRLLLRVHRRAAHRPAAVNAQIETPHRLHRLPEGDPAQLEPVGGTRPSPRALRRRAPRRALRGHGAARSLRRRRAHLLPVGCADGRLRRARRRHHRRRERHRPWARPPRRPRGDARRARRRRGARPRRGGHRGGEPRRRDARGPHRRQPRGRGAAPSPTRRTTASAPSTCSATTPACSRPGSPGSAPPPTGSGCSA